MHHIWGASPDVKVVDVGCSYPYGLSEVKCPETKFLVTPLNACCDGNFFSGGHRWSTPSETQSQVLYTSPGSYGCNWCDNDRHHQQQSFSGLLSPEQSNHTNTINSVNSHQQQSFSGLLSPGLSNHTNTINSVNCHQQQSFSGLLSPGQ